MVGELKSCICELIQWTLAVAVCLAMGCSRSGEVVLPQTPDGKTKVTLQLNWYPEAEHGGFYAALVHGYYADAGLEVEILAGGPDTPVIQQVATARATFGVVNADNILYGLAEGAKIVPLMAPLQTSPRCLIVHRAAGIKGFDDLKNMTLAMSTQQAFSFYLRKQVPLTGVTVVPYPGNVARFLTDQNYGQQGYVFSEPYLIEKNGGDPQVLMLADLGFNPYTSVLFTSRAVADQHPQVVAKLSEASIRGWQQYLKSPDETNRHIHQLNPEMDLDVLEYGAKAIVPLTESDATKQQGFGAMTHERWQTLIGQMEECKLIDPGSVPAVELPLE